jgi:hypothetical protein
VSLRRDQLQRRQPHTVPVSCYCSICRKSAGSGGYAINIMGIADTLKVKGKSALGVWNAPIDGHRGSAKRHYCKRCGTPLWVSDEQWPELVHPFASAIDTELPKAPSCVHLLLRDKASWVEPQMAPMMTASMAIPNCRSRTGTKNTGCGSNDGTTLSEKQNDRRRSIRRLRQTCPQPGIRAGHTITRPRSSQSRRRSAVFHRTASGSCRVSDGDRP